MGIKGEKNPAKRPEVREKLRLSKLGDKNPAKRPEVREKIRQTLTGRKISKDALKKRNTPSYGKWNLGLKRTEETKQKMRDAKLKNPTRYWCGLDIPENMKRKIREGVVKYIIKNGSCRIGTNEKEILDQIEYEFNLKIKRQHPVCGYLLDGFSKKYNIAFEVDERGHIFRQEKDKKRQNIIEKEINCTFIRIQDY